MRLVRELVGEQLAGFRHRVRFADDGDPETGGGEGVTAGQAEYIETLASAGVAAVVDGVFLEVHDNPAKAKSDAQNALKLDLLEPLLRRLVAIDVVVKQPAPVLNGRPSS